VSRLEANATRPLRETRPQVGRTPTSPQWAAGRRIDPPVSLPSANAAARAATAAAAPLDDPPATRSGAHGLRAHGNGVSSPVEPMPNSSSASLPSSTAPAARRRRTTVAS
jgi:cytoskeletal protein RodZ